MTRRLAFVDRTVTLLVALLLVAGGLALIDWQTQLVLPWPESLDAQPVLDVVTATWFAWAAAGATVLLGLLGLWWLLAHVPRPAGTQLRTASGDRDGTVKVDLSSIADAAADRFGTLTPVLDSHGSCRVDRGQDVVEIRARVDVRSSADLVHEAAARTEHEITTSTSTTGPAVRILLEAPRRLPLPTNSGPARVH